MDYKELGITDEQYEKLKTIGEDVNAKYGTDFDFIGLQNKIIKSYSEMKPNYKAILKLIKESYKYFGKKKINRFKKMRVGGKRF